MDEGMQKLYKKILKISEECGNLEKLGHNDYQNYDYLRESDVVNALRPLLIKHGLVVEMNEEEYERLEEEDLTRVTYLYSLIDTESGASVTTKMTSEGKDKGDKAAYKAITGGIKYYLIRRFLLTSGDDPEKSSESGGAAKKSVKRRSKKSSKRIKKASAFKAK